MMSSSSACPWVRHISLVFRDSNGEEYVIRSGPKRPYLPWICDMRVETNVPIEDSADDRDSETPAERLTGFSARRAMTR